MTLFRYSGGKSKVKSTIISKLLSSSAAQYVEPFVGGGSIFLNLLATKKYDKVILNDFDPGIAAIWTAILQTPDALKEKIIAYTPSVDSYEAFKTDLLSSVPYNDQVELAFQKIAIHQMSFSGLGTKAGSPIGGKSQNSNYKIDCRWSPGGLRKKIDKYHRLLSYSNVVDNKCFNQDFSTILKGADKDSLIYLDPPYLEKGQQLYQHFFTLDDHKRLAEQLDNFRGDFLLSYDDHPTIRSFYSKFKIETISLNYTINQITDSNGNLTANTKNELLISNY